MSVYSASRGYSTDPLPDREPQSPIDWARQRLSGRTTRRLAAAGQRAGTRLQHLGPAWHVVDWPHAGVVARPTRNMDPRVPGHVGFLAIGPGGVFAVTAVDQGRSRIMLAGEVVQINGRRPPYVARARRDAARASAAISAAVGAKVPVVPVLAFVGTGVISMQGLPKDCVVTNHRELDRVLAAGGERISAVTAAKLSEVASHPDTWADAYRWYPNGQTASDKRQAAR